MGKKRQPKMELCGQHGGIETFHIDFYEVSLYGM